MALPLAFLGIIYLLVSYVGYLVLQSVLTKRHNARRARELKCLDPPALPSTSHPRYRPSQDRPSSRQEQGVPRRVGTASGPGWRADVHVLDNGVDDDFHFCHPRDTVQRLRHRPQRRRNFFPLLGNGIFTQDGAGWEHSRTMMRPQFARDQVSDLDLEEQHVQNLMRAIVPNANGWTDTIDLQVLFFRLTLDSATEFLFGESVDSQLVGLPGYVKDSSRDASEDGDVVVAAFDKGQSVLATRSRMQGLYWLYNPSDFKKSCTDCHAFIDHFVRLALSKDLPSAAEKSAPADAEKGKKEKYVFLEALAAETRDPIELRSQMLNILLAGRDTTASLIGWVFYSLARDPVRYAKLRNIILEEFGTYSQPRDITFARLKSCQYLQYVNNEALRLYPVARGGPDGKSPIFIPKGRACDYSVFVMHRRKDLWGADADEFIPERWEKRRVGWDFLPFNGGPRICIGQQFALTEASYVIVRLLQRFDAVENQDFSSKALHNLTLTSCSGTGVVVKLHAAEE
ncbi:hypothetical protein VE04_05732 [Pseudogymnoascus sp. 24MN13]|nr:hypothetical protein VE04_05732 [Pseudogymnoascus sp. 24MN13]